jgi:hypothetical protein
MAELLSAAVPDLIDVEHRSFGGCWRSKRPDGQSQLELFTVLTAGLAAEAPFHNLIWRTSIQIVEKRNGKRSAQVPEMRPTNASGELTRRRERQLWRGGLQDVILAALRSRDAD